MEEKTLQGVYLSLRRNLALAVAGVVPPHEVEDVVQESYVRLVRASRKRDIEHPRSYLMKTVRNLALDRVRRSDYRLNDSLDEEPQDDREASLNPIYDQVASSEEFDYFCEAVRILPVQCRRVFVLKKVYGYSQREISEELGITESTVEKHVERAVRRCTEYMNRHVWGEP